MTKESKIKIETLLGLIAVVLLTILLSFGREEWAESGIIILFTLVGAYYIIKSDLK
jgi:hypothetical protein